MFKSPRPLRHIKLIAILCACLTVWPLPPAALRAQTAPGTLSVHQVRPAPAPTAAPAAAFGKSEHVLEFISTYRENKEPARLADAVQAMVRFGLISDPEKAGIYTGFLAGVIGENQVDADKLIAGMFPMPPTEQVVLIKAIAYSGLPDWKELMGRFVERMPARKVLIRKYLFGDGLTLEALPLDDPFVLDVYWGYYFATGSWQPASRLIDALAWAGERNDIDKLTIGSMAKWTYATNATRDKNLLDLAKTQLAHRPESVALHLREVIEAAELFETHKLRSKAVKAIEELQTKGSQFKRDWNTWGTAGQTVLALGCVAAGALGQVQFGIPCVVGGALSSAALNYLGPSK